MLMSGIHPWDRKTTFLVSRDGVITAANNQAASDPIVVDVENGSGIALLRIARRLAADAFVTSPSNPKERPHRAVKITAKLAATEGFSRIALDCIDQILTSARLVCQQCDAGSECEALHQMRVGLRRLRTAFAAFKSILLADDLDAWRKDMRWIAGELDAARNLDVFIEHVASLKGKRSGDDPAWALFVSRLRMMRAAAYEQALVAIESQRFAAFIGNCAEWADAAGGNAAAGATHAREGKSSVVARQVLSRLHHRLRKAGDHLARRDPAGRHIARIGAKKLRYTAEFFGKTFDRSEEGHRLRYIRTLAELQDALGELNDLAMIEKCACAVAGYSAQLAFHAGQIIGDRRSEETRLLSNAVRAYGCWREARPFWH